LSGRLQSVAVVQFEYAANDAADRVVVVAVVVAAVALAGVRERDRAAGTTDEQPEATRQADAAARRWEATRSPPLRTWSAPV
jgi:hypothetical protein